MPTIHLKGPGLNNWFSEQLVRDLGAEGARKATCGAAREAVEHVIAKTGTGKNSTCNYGPAAEQENPRQP